MMQERTGDGALDSAIFNLDRALAQLESRMAAAQAQAAPPHAAEDDDRARLAADLEAARERERELQAAGSEAARALGRAIAEIRAALGEDAAAALEQEV